MAESMAASASSCASQEGGVAALRRGAMEGIRREAADIWEKAERDLAKAVRARGHRAQESEVPQPLRRASAAQDARCPNTSGEKTKGDARHSAAAAGSSDEERKAKALARSARLKSVRASAFDTRAELMKRRSAETNLRLAGHGKRKLRKKIADVIIEVRRRQALQRQQERTREFRERREKVGQGPSASLGDADPYALGLVGLGGTLTNDRVQGGASPRRTCILGTLSLEELDQLRRDPWFFFECPTLEILESVSASLSTESFGKASATTTDPTLEPLIDFFTPSREDKDLPVTEFAQKLREQLLADSAAASAMEPEPVELATRDGSLREDSTDTHFLGPFELMPCCGRRGLVRLDEASPTLKKVRAVYDRREALDAKWVEDKRDAMERRFTVNEFKAREQQRELQLQALNQKEMHKVRIREAEERKALQDFEASARRALQGAEKHQRLAEAQEKAESATETKREKASTTLESWCSGVTRSERYLRERELEQTILSEANWGKYMDRLWKLGIERHGAAESHQHKNEQLKVNVQGSLVAQLAEQQKNKGAAIAEALDAKMRAADLHRQKTTKGARYNFVERAFGSQATTWDAKYHSVSVDRRNESWLRSTEGGGWPAACQRSFNSSRSLSETSMRRTATARFS